MSFSTVSEANGYSLFSIMFIFFTLSNWKSTIKKMTDNTGAYSL